MFLPPNRNVNIFWQTHSSAAWSDLLPERSRFGHVSAAGGVFFFFWLSEEFYCQRSFFFIIFFYCEERGGVSLIVVVAEFTCFQFLVWCIETSAVKIKQTCFCVKIVLFSFLTAVISADGAKHWTCLNFSSFSGSIIIFVSRTQLPTRHIFRLK